MITSHHEARSGYANPDSALDSVQFEDKKQLIIEFENFTQRVEAIVPPCADRTVALRKLMEASFWAKQALR